jgi:hypothetical protein
VAKSAKKLNLGYQISERIRFVIQEIMDEKYAFALARN